MIKPAYSVSFPLSINIFVWQNVLYFPNDLRSKYYFRVLQFVQWVCVFYAQCNQDIFYFSFLFYNFVQLSCKSNTSLEYCEDKKKGNIMEVKLAALKEIQFCCLWSREGKLQTNEVFIRLYCPLAKCN